MNSLDTWMIGTGSVAIAGHVRPDGDCVGSCLAVYNYIRDSYPAAEVSVYLDPMPRKYAFLQSYDAVTEPAYDMPRKNYDLFIALDCADEERLGKAVKHFRGAGHTVCVDHHLSNGSFAEENVIDAAASSTCEMVYRLMDKNKITKEIAECLYVGLVSDTGVFQYSCTSSETMRIAGDLMNRGIDYPWIVDHTFFMKTYEQVRVTGYAYLKAKRHLDDRVISTVITAAEMQEFGVLPRHLDGIVSELRSVRGVEVAIFLYQNEESGFKVSMRSAAQVNVAEIASRYGGGGHARAAGATIKDKGADEIIALLLQEIEQQLCTTES